MKLGRRAFTVGALSALALPHRKAFAAEDTVRVPVTLSGNRVLVPCSLGGAGPWPFVLDTGGTIGLIDMDLVRSLKLRKLGNSMLSLVTGRRPYPIYAGPDLVFGGQIRQRSSAFAGVEKFGFGQGSVGSLAAGVLTAVDADLDLGVGEWRIYRGGAPDRAGWTRYEKGIVRSGNPFGSPFMLADVVIKGQRFRFGLDTGMPGAMRLYRKVAEAIGVWDAPRWTPIAPNGEGRMIRLPSMEIAGTTIKGAFANLRDAAEWEVFENGILGLPVLQHFDIGTSVSDQAVYLRANGLPQKPVRYNRAGLWISREKNGVGIAAVGGGSPADAMGLRVGDLLIGADFDTMLGKMFEPAGTVIPLTVESGGVRRDIVLTLTDFL